MLSRIIGVETITEEGDYGPFREVRVDFEEKVYVRKINPRRGHDDSFGIARDDARELYDALGDWLGEQS